MPEYSYCYLLGAVFNLAAWAICYRARKDLRVEMVVMSGVPLLVGLPQEYWLWTRDWWHPPNLTGTRIGFEDVLYAIGTGGTLSVLFAVLGRRGLVPGPAPSRLVAVIPLLINLTLPFLCVLLAGAHSFVATTIGTCAAVAWILPSRPDLARPAAISAGLGLFLGFFCFWLIEWLMPGFVAAIWDLPRLSGLVIAGVPVEDLAWYSYTAALFGIYYKYATGARFTSRVSPPRFWESKRAADLRKAT